MEKHLPYDYHPTKNSYMVRDGQLTNQQVKSSFMNPVQTSVRQTQVQPVMNMSGSYTGQQISPTRRSLGQSYVQQPVQVPQPKVTRTVIDGNTAEGQALLQRKYAQEGKVYNPVLSGHRGNTSYEEQKTDFSRDKAVYYDQGQFQYQAPTAKLQQIAQQYVQPHYPSKLTPFEEHQYRINKWSWSDDDFLGEGFISKTYECFLECKIHYEEDESQLAQEYTIKIYDKSKFPQGDYTAMQMEDRFAHEQTFQSKHVQTCIHYEQDPFYLYVIHRKARGNLLKFIQHNGRTLDEHKAVDILRQIMNAFHEFQRTDYRGQPIIHRNLKMENILFFRGHTFKCANFSYNDVTDVAGQRLNAKDRKLVGQIICMAPQLLCEIPYTNKCDVWSIGMIFYQMLFGDTPWPARDTNSFLESIRKNPVVRFPVFKNVSNAARNFIKKCLKIDESERASLEDLFNAPLLKNNDVQKVKEPPRTNFDGCAIKILISIQLVMTEEGTQLKHEFDKIDTDRSGHLDKDELFNLCKRLNPNIGRVDSDNMFEQIDVNKDGHIDFNEFRTIVEEWSYEDIFKIYKHVLRDVKSVIKHNNYDILNLFHTYDGDHGQTLDFDHFVKFIRIIVPAFSLQNCHDLFSYFDYDSDGEITLDDIYEHLTTENEKI